MKLIKIILILSTSSSIFCTEEERTNVLESIAKIHIEHNRKFNEEFKKVYGSEEIKNPEHIDISIINKQEK